MFVVLTNPLQSLAHGHQQDRACFASAQSPAGEEKLTDGFELTQWTLHRSTGFLIQTVSGVKVPGIRGQQRVGTSPLLQLDSCHLHLLHSLAYHQAGSSETLYPAPRAKVPPSAALPEQMISISPCIWDPVHLRNGDSIPGNFSNQTAQATPLQVEALEIHLCIEGESQSDSPKPRSVTLAAVTEL